METRFFVSRKQRLSAGKDWSQGIKTNFSGQNINSWLTVTRLPPNILSASATSRITRCDWPNFHFRALFG